MGVDPEEVFEIVHRANMGKIFPDGQAHFDEVTHKILKPNDWEEKYAPEPAIQKELERLLGYLAEVERLRNPLAPSGGAAATGEGQGNAH